MSIELWVPIVIVFLLGYRFVYYAERACFLKRFLDEYSNYMKKPSDAAAEVLLDGKVRMKNLLMESAVSKAQVTRVEPIGYGLIKTSHTDVVDNFMMKDQEIVTTFLQLSHEALGYFRWKRNETVNPIFWIDFVVRLPKYLIEYFNPDASSGPFYKLLQLGYWILSVVYMLVQLKIVTLPLPP